MARSLVLMLFAGCSLELPQLGEVNERCGDGIRQALEACDDGNGSDEDACLNNCQIARCGDGVVRSDLGIDAEGAEACDDGNINDRDACTNTCRLAVCGDGLRRADLAAGSQSECCGTGRSNCPEGEVCAGGRCWLETYEHCDDGNDDDDDGCTQECLAPQCGDGFVQAGEECDDGNCSESDSCLGACQSARCGDGVLQEGVEECEDGNIESGDGCNGSCQREGCGNGRLDEGEACDDRNLELQGACVGCELGLCGDGVVWEGQEACDDGNLLPGDTCSVDCRLDDHGNDFETATVVSLESHALRGMQQVVSDARIGVPRDTDLFKITANRSGRFRFHAVGLGSVCTENEQCALHESCQNGYCAARHCSNEENRWWGYPACPEGLTCNAYNRCDPHDQLSPSRPLTDPTCRVYTADRRLAGFQDDQNSGGWMERRNCNVELYLEQGEDAYLGVSAYERSMGYYHVLLQGPCGNGLLDPGEECDPDARDSNYYRCRADCRQRRRLVMAGGVGCVEVDGGVNCWGSQANRVITNWDDVPNQHRRRCHPMGSPDDYRIDVVKVPQQVIGPEARVLDLSGGVNENICALYGRDQHAYCWGREGDASVPVSPLRAEAAEWVLCEGEEPPPAPTPAMEAAGQVYRAGSCLGTPTVYGMGRVDDYPEVVSSLRGVSVGAHSKCMVRGSSAYCWGSAAEGILGIQTAVNENWTGALTPQFVTMPNWLGVDYIAIGVDTACAILQRGQVVCWGRNDYGQTGSGGVATSALCEGVCDVVPVLVDADLGYVVHLAVGGDHVCALDFRGSVYCWGRNDKWQTGVESDEQPCGEMACVRRPRRVPEVEGINDIALGKRHSCALNREGEVICWGSNSKGQLGMGARGGLEVGDGFNFFREPVRVGLLPRIVGLATGHHTNCARTSDGRVFCWGANDTGQLGNGVCNNASALPIEVNLEF